MTPEKDTMIQIKRLANDTEYFTHVFKKTEKLVSVIFYILSHSNKGQKANIHFEYIKDKALETHTQALETLRLQSHEVTDGLESFMHSLVALESTLRVAEAAGAVPPKLAELLYEQLDLTERYLKHHYLSDTGVSLESVATELGLTGSVSPYTQTSSARVPATRSTPSAPRRRRVAIPAGDISSDAHFVYSQLTDRSDRIRTVLEAKPQATIKDIAEIITDVSEKTIQRELNSLIEKGQVRREGERRWSKYSVNK